MINDCLCLFCNFMPLVGDKLMLDYVDINQSKGEKLPLRILCDINQIRLKDHSFIEQQIKRFSNKLVMNPNRFPFDWFFQFLQKQINKEIEKLFTSKVSEVNRKEIAIFNHLSLLFSVIRKSWVRNSLCRFKFHATLANIRNHFSVAGKSVKAFKENLFSHVKVRKT